MLLRRVFVILTSSLLLAATVFTGVALAADDSVSVTNVRVTPSSLSGDGQVTVTVNVAVDQARTTGITGAYIDGAGVDVSSQAATDIQIGENKDLSCTLSVSAAQLGSPITLSVKWAGEITGNAFTVTVKSAAPTLPQVNFYRTIDKTAVTKGESVTLIYYVENTGSVDISNIEITDDGIGSAMKLTKDGLKAGSSTALTYSYKVNSDFTSMPQLTFVAGGKTYTATCPSKTVLLKNEQLDAVLSLANASDTIKSGDEITLICSMTNSGNVKLTNIVVSEKVLGSKLYTTSSIDKDARKEFSKKVMLTQTTTFQFVITAKDDAGDTLTFNSNELTVTVDSGSSQYDLEIMVNSDALQLSEPGVVNFSFVINNKGMDIVTNANVIDQNGNVIQKLDSIATGSTQFTYPTNILTTTQYTFSLVVPGSTNGNYQVSTGPLEIKVIQSSATPAVSASVAPTLSPDVSPSPGATDGEASSGKLNALMTALAVVGVLIVITIIVLVAMVIAEKKRQNKRVR